MTPEHPRKNPRENPWLQSTGSFSIFGGFVWDGTDRDPGTKFPSGFIRVSGASSSIPENLQESSRIPKVHLTESSRILKNPQKSPRIFKNPQESQRILKNLKESGPFPKKLNDQSPMIIKNAPLLLPPPSPLPLLSPPSGWVGGWEGGSG